MLPPVMADEEELLREKEELIRAVSRANPRRSGLECGIKRSYVYGHQTYRRNVINLILVENT